MCGFKNIQQLVNRINIVAKHLFFFLVMAFRKLREKFFAEVYFHEIGLKDSFAEKKIFVCDTHLRNSRRAGSGPLHKIQNSLICIVRLVKIKKRPTQQTK